jgi:tRNA(Arg) A34 adenosine deaminase TadA
LLDVYAAVVEASRAGLFLRDVSAASTLPAHVKRVRRLPPQPGVPPQLDVVLCLASPSAAGTGGAADAADEFLPPLAAPADPPDSPGSPGAGARRSEDEDWLHVAPPGVPREVVTLVAEMALQPRRACVPAHAPATRAAWAEWSAIWPLHWRPHSNDPAQPSPGAVDAADAALMRGWAARAAAAAAGAAAAGGGRNAALIVDPRFDSLVGRGLDGSRPAAGRPGHPLHHAIMVALGAVAERDCRLWPESALEAARERPAGQGPEPGPGEAGACLAPEQGGHLANGCEAGCVPPCAEACAARLGKASPAANVCDGAGESAGADRGARNAPRPGSSCMEPSGEAPDGREAAQGAAPACNGSTASAGGAHGGHAGEPSPDAYVADASGGAACSVGGSTSTCCMQLQGVAVRASSLDASRVAPPGGECCSSADARASEAPGGAAHANGFCAERGAPPGGGRCAGVAAQGPGAGARDPDPSSGCTGRAWAPPAPAAPKPYLCTGFDCYVAAEPCAMCAMALVHSRVRRVVFCEADPDRGALGGRFRLHGCRSLNHHYKVYRCRLPPEGPDAAEQSGAV